MIKKILSGIAFLFLLKPFSPLSAAPEGKIILTISGLITHRNSNGVAQFDLKALESLGVTTIETHTPWFKGMSRFEGVSLSKLMDTVGAQGKRAKVTALNDYITVIPLTDFVRYNPVLAFRRDGKIMGVRDKGPLFIIYPYDKNTELENQIIYSRSAWQVYRIEIE